MTAFRYPTPADILAARTAAGLTQDASAKTVHVTLRTWQRWEYGTQPADLGHWELFLLKTGQKKL